uniref:Nodule Cysteine-Rich (NCR) secreted peptide n=1 Tax=Caenorhabditis japonica TaxID=281687 RepID=A0A8R1ITU8_CAEJA
MFQFSYFLLLILILPISTSTPRGECLTDRNCSNQHKCVNHHCFHRNEHVFKCVGDVTCPEFHVCRNNVCLVDIKKSHKKFRRHLRTNDHF